MTHKLFKPLVIGVFAFIAPVAWGDGPGEVAAPDGGPALQAVEPTEIGPAREVSPASGATVKEPETVEEIRATLFPLVQVRKSEHRENVKVGNVLVGEAYSYKRRDGHSRTELLDVPFASLAKREEYAPDHKEFRLVNLPMTSLIEAEQHGKRGSLKLVDVPLFTLVHNEDKGEGQFDNKFIKLPIVGSLFRHKRTERKEKVRFLFFSHTRHFNDDRGDDAATKDRPRRKPGRSRY